MGYRKGMELVLEFGLVKEWNWNWIYFLSQHGQISKNFVLFFCRPLCHLGFVIVLRFPFSD